jgi:hypothetical protein
MVTDEQVRKLMKIIQTEVTQSVAAAKAGMSDKTARKYLRLGKLPSQTQKPRDWRTRPDVYAEIWEEIEEILKRDASVEAITIFDYLCRQYEGKFQQSQLRTLQRRIKVWRALHGTPQEVMFAQTYLPGEQCQSDYTHMGNLGVRIAGQHFDHLFYHFCLPYSNWETGSICFSESFESLSGGLQNALWELGAVPKQHRTDSLSAAVNNLSEKEEFTARYCGLLAHYNMSASHTNAGRGHENGDVEQSHYRFKKAVAQELILRGSADFYSRTDYEEFLRRLLKRRNASRREKLQAEIIAMRPLPIRRVEDYTRLSVKVTRDSIINVRKNVYSVNSQLIGERVVVKLHAEFLEIYYSTTLVDQFPRLRGEGKAAINYRHIIHSLIRKPGAWRNYRYQHCLFPRVNFRIAYDYLAQHYPATAEKQYLMILQMAAEISEERVAEILRHLITAGETITAQRVKELLMSSEPLATAQLLEVYEVELAAYDGLLQEVRA